MKGHKRKYILILLFISLLCRSWAQEKPSSGISVGVHGHYGSFLTNEPKAQYLRDGYSYFVEWYLQKGNNQELLHNRHRKPWGIGVFYGHSGGRQYIGSMSGAFAYSHLPVIIQNHFSSSIRVGAGLGWIEKPYDKSTNHKNVLIGSHLNGFLNLAWLNEVKVTSRLHLLAGLSFSHLSNGGTSLPNLGLNIPAFTMGFRYKSSSENYFNSTPETTLLRKTTTYTLYSSAGWKQVPWVDSKRYMINALSADIGKRVSYHSAYGGGASLFYNRSLEVDPTSINPSQKRKGNKLQTAAYAYYEYHTNKFSFPLQVGVYLLNQDIFPSVFQQVGLRYRVSDRWSLQALLKTHAGKADFIHAGVGYKVK